ncbi:MAG: class I SAM-dependent methyltransferase, partial [Actinobacteria bacterium]|nr:class I SAM-dependent methyltransferase [Actinomycetota bacterium]
MEQEQWDQLYAGTELVWTAGPNQFVAEELAGEPPGRVLDLGTGEGRNAIWLAGQGWQVTAVDFAAAGLAKAQRLAAARGVTVEWVQADLRRYQPAQGAYDLVLIAYIHLPWAEFAALLSAAESALAPGGTLLVVGHDADNISRGYGGPQDPEILHRAGDVVAALPGLAIRRAGQARRKVQTDAGERVAIDTVVRAQRA